MKYFFNVLIVIVLVLLAACTKDINLDDFSERRLVLDGRIESDSTAHLRVYLSKSVTDANGFEVVDDLEVRMSDDLGNEEQLSYQAGEYSSQIMMGIPGRTYRVELDYQQEKYVAETKIPVPTIQLDSFVLVSSLDNLGTDSMPLFFQEMTVFLKKTTSEPIYCIFQVIRDGVNVTAAVYYKNESAQIGQLSQGLGSIFVADNSNIDFTLKMWQVEKEIYDYLDAVNTQSNNQVLGGLLIGPPGKINGNVEGAGLGYFGGFLRDEIQAEIP